MSTKTISPEVPVDERSTAETPTDPVTDPASVGEGLPFESPEFGLGGFLPHLDAATDE